LNQAPQQFNQFLAALQAAVAPININGPKTPNRSNKRKR